MPRYTHTTPGRRERVGINPFTQEPLVIPGKPDRVRFWEGQRNGDRLELSRGIVGMTEARWSRSFPDEQAAAAHLSACSAAREREGFVLRGDATTLLSARRRTEAAEIAERLLGVHFDLADGPNETRSLEIGRQPGSEWTLAHLVDAIASAMPPKLERLFLGVCNLEMDRLKWMSLGDCEPLFDLPSIRELAFEGVGFQLGYANTPTLTKLELRVSALSRESLAAIFASDLPSLTHLVLWLDGSEDDDDPPPPIDCEDLEPLFDGALFPKLTHLGIQNTALSRMVALKLATSPLLARLESLDLSHGKLHSSWSQLEAVAPAFKHLRSLDVSFNNIPQSDIHHWRGLAQTVICDQDGPGMITV